MVPSGFFGAILSLMIGTAQPKITALLLLLVFIYLKDMVGNTARRGWCQSKDSKSPFQSCVDWPTRLGYLCT